MSVQAVAAARVKAAKPNGFGNYNARNNQWYKIAQKNGMWQHQYKDGHHVDINTVSPGKGFSTYDKGRKLWYKSADDGLRTSRTYQNGKTVQTGAGKYVQGMGQNAVKNLPLAEAEWNARVKPQLDTYQQQLSGMQERYANARGDTQAQYQGLGQMTGGIMDKISSAQQGAQSQLDQIAQGQQASIKSATPQYAGPLGQIAQRMAGTEEQSALNRAGAANSANQAYGVQTGANREVLAGQTGAAGQVGAQRSLSDMAMQQRQQEQPWNLNIADLKANRNGAILDALMAIGNTQANQSRAERLAASKIAKEQSDAALAAAQTAQGGFKPTAPKAPSSTAPNSKGITPSVNRTFWTKAKTGEALLNANASGHVLPHTQAGSNSAYSFLLSKGYTNLEAYVARAFWWNGGRLTPSAASTAKQAGYDVSPYGVKRP
ncbi:hypothetical protein UFOVP1346_20 [uncultured Caudovirales phage]|uniref:Uncharacterized protein n=1 Tax=uncultured Caudovirales phage TaxID=2100421 RepID=A0A6J5QYS5_9CAUD|nr:hypothetical protein UFOVP921_60 [uncultured Caudovirales phage]CAB4187586.1 hypothetical protein UFOVP1156_36 [uncultured Caudovirales phage]CAB4200054.1 hypothetical protein UFOVP1346_20 [uncultured Caudovirales phage]